MASSSQTLSDYGERTDPSYSAEDVGVADHGERTDASDSEEDVGVADNIFLSHSGKQKDFVEYLYKDLRNANLTTFFDTHSLAKADPFPPKIKRAARRCQLGVFVLSNDFLTHKWPMLELEIMSEKNIKLLPLFYELSPEDLKCKEKLCSWQKEWETLVDDKEQTGKWGKAVKKLRSYNGEVLKKGGNVFEYIKKVVTTICSLIPSGAIYNLSGIEGLQHLEEEIERHFDSLLEGATRCKRACIVGLYGVAGLGKTTLCMSMVNHHTSSYIGRSHLIRFPGEGDDWTVVKECKRALRRLANLSEKVLEENDNFDQVIQLMHNHLKDHDVFLAMDNVRAEHKEQAEKLLGVGFTVNSKILLTSRSERVLRSILSKHKKNSYIGSLPSLKQEHALKIFQNSLNHDCPLQCPVQLENFVMKCRFDGKYHPKAVSAVGGYTRKILEVDEVIPEKIEHELSIIFEELDLTEALKDVHEDIKLTYGRLSQHLKEIFLDIALWIPHKRIGYYHERTFVNAVQWLQFFFKASSTTHIKGYISDLALAGVIQIEMDERGKQMIGLLDLYAELAWNEAIGTKFLASTKEGVRCKEIKRLLLEGVTGDECMELQPPGRHGWRQLQLLYAATIKVRTKIDPKTVPALRVLILKKTMHKINLKGLVQLSILSLQDCDFIASFEDLCALRNLKMLHIEGCHSLRNLKGVGHLTQLEALKVQNCGALKELAFLGGVTGLTRLTLRSVEEASGRLGPALKTLSVGRCGALQKLSLGGVTGLEKLTLFENGSLEEVSGCLRSALMESSVEGCEALQRLADLDLDDLERTRRDRRLREEVRAGPEDPARSRWCDCLGRPQPCCQRWRAYGSQETGHRDCGTSWSESLKWTSVRKKPGLHVH